MTHVPWHPTLRELRWFAGLQWVFFTFLAIVWWSRGGSPERSLIVSGSSAVVATWGLISPQTVLWIYRGWMLAVFPMGWVISRLALALAFYLVLTPIACLMRFTRQDPLARKFDRAAESYWISRPPPPEQSRYFRQF